MINLELIREVSSAIRAGDIQLVKSRFEKNEALIHEEASLGSWLHVAAFCGQFEIVKYLVTKGLPINIQTSHDDTKPLFLATEQGHYEIATFLLDNGADLDTSKSTVNPLLVAIVTGHSEIAKELISRGIDTTIVYNTETMNNMTALDLAKEYGRTEIIAMLEEITKN